MTFWNKLRKISLTMAESVDAWRIIPRLILICYAYLVADLYIWYRNIPTYVQETCDAAVLQTIIQSDLPIERLKPIACTVKDVVGGPTTNQTALVTTIIGLTSVIFGLYTGTGRRWEKDPPNKKDNIE